MSPFRSSKCSHIFFAALTLTLIGTITTARANDEEIFWHLSQAVDSTRMRHGIEILTSNGSRTTGYPGAVAAADWIESEWQESGVVRTGRWAVPTAMPLDRGATITIGERVLTIHSMWPNVVRTSQTPPQGLSGQLIYGGHGSYVEFDGLDVEGAIALLEFPGQLRWLDAFDLGVTAVIFLAPENPHRTEASNTFLSTVADLPRYYADKDVSKELRELAKGNPQSRVHATMQWERVRAEVVLGLIEGTDESLADQPIVFSAYYDAPSVVPALSPGAEAASGIVALNEVVRVLGNNPVARPIILMAMPGHFQSLNGARHVAAYLDSLREVETPHILPRELSPTTITMDDVARLNPMTFIGLDLSSGDRLINVSKIGPPFGLLGHFHRRNEFGVDGVRMVELAESFEKRAYSDSSMIVGTTIVAKLERTYLGAGLPQPLLVDSAPFGLSGWLGLTFSTGNDDRARFDTPQDTPDHVNMGNLLEQVRFVVYTLQGLNGPRDDFPSDLEKNQFGTVNGRAVRFDPTEGPFPDTPVAGAIVRARMKMKTVNGVRGDVIVMADDDGGFFIPGMEYGRIYRSEQPFTMEVYGLNPTSGTIEFAADMGASGDLRYPIRVVMDRRHQKVVVVTFRANPTTIFDIIDPRYLFTLDKMMVIEAGREAEPIQFGVCMPITPSEVGIFGYGDRKTYLGSDIEPVAVAFTAPRVKLKLAMTTGELGLGRRLVALNADQDHPTGKGFSFDLADGSPNRITTSAYQVAHDTEKLNGFRLSTLTAHGIENPRLSRLHAKSSQLLSEAKSAYDAKLYGRFIALSRSAWGYASRAYTDVRNTTDDVVHGVVFFLVMLLPFSYVGERLVIDAKTVTGQIFGAASVFGVAFLALRWAHPAFALAISPIVLLLAFVILALSVAVTGIAISKLNRRLHKAVSQKMLNHAADVSRSGMLMTAARLGVGQMRRRSVRTGLTGATIVVLTFSVLSFTSIRSVLRFNQLPLGDGARYNGILVRLPNWSAVEAPVVRQLFDRFSHLDGAVVTERVWRPARTAQGQRAFFILRREGQRELGVPIQGLLGLGPGESSVTGLDRELVAGRWFREPDEASCIISESLAIKLGIGPDDVGSTKLTTLGGSFTIVGLLNSTALDRTMDLNGEPLTPLEPDAQQASEGRTTVGISRSGAASIYIHLKGDELVVVPAVWAKRLGGTVNSVAISLPEGTVQEELEEWMPILALNIYAGIDGMRYVLRSVGLTSLQGSQDVIMPIILVVLIVTNTMLGSVYERTREIGTFNAIGLAPTHIAGLFVAEAAVYATLGAILGYLIGQIGAKLITTIGLLPGLTLNYSSISAVGTIALVMAVVVASSIWPARQASRVSVPGIERSWTLPPPVGDILSTSLPFMLSRTDAEGVMPFLKEYFEMYSDESLGVGFSTQLASLTSDVSEEAPHLLEVTVWLAPFDLGISQTLKLTTHVDDDDMLAIEVDMIRLSGDHDSWSRSNRGLLNHVRQQFLVWRALTPEVRESYRSENA